MNRSLSNELPHRIQSDHAYVEKDFGNKPILRLAGGKQHLTPLLMSLAPQDIYQRRYVEPFLGGGALFLALEPPRARLNDLNPLLLDMYRFVRDEPESVHKHLTSLAEKHSESFYYEVRTSFNGAEPCDKKAAQFIYLNRSCYNGVLRVNQKSEFNVPWGKKQRVLIPTVDNLIRLSRMLTNAEMLEGDFAEALIGVGQGDFVYLDPPYPPVSQTAFFQHYTAVRFSSLDHEKVAERASVIATRGAQVMISYADTPAVRKMFSDWHFTSASRPRYVTAKKSKVRRAAELVITNYDVTTDDGRRDGHGSF